MALKKVMIVILMLFSVLTSWSKANQLTVMSPDKKIQVTILDNQGVLTYEVKHEGVLLVNRSPLGLERNDQKFSSGLKYKSSKTSVVDEHYTLLVGKKLENHTTGNELLVEFRNKQNKQLEITFRVYNDGIAFRYNFPEKDNVAHTITNELSGFAIPKEAKAFIQPYDLNVRNKPCYETYYENGIAADTPSPKPVGWAFPALFQVGQKWLMITEAGLDETYCATHLENKNGSLYTIRFPEKEEVTSTAAPEPISSLPWKTPWRLIIMGNSLSTIIESSLVTSLNPPSLINDTSWIIPGRASWSWWSNGATTKSFDMQREYIDFNASMGWEYVLIDAAWQQMEGGTMEELVKYATSKGVGIFLWYHSGMGREKDTLSYANMFAFPEERRKELQKIKDWGVKGIKVDFFDSDKQPVIKRYFDIMKDAADFQIMVNFHGSTLPRGWERTYPHLVSMESVKGAEGYGRQDFCDRAPVHNTILPFTRNAVGPMDYTPVTFTNKREAIRQTTFAHELALSIVFESGVFHFADRLNSYRLLPDEPKKFLKEVPVTWDETRYLTGYPGKYVVLARQSGGNWYIGGINGLREAVEISFDLPEEIGQSVLTIITDGEDKGDFKTYELKANGNVKLTLKPMSGFVARAK